MQNLQKYPEIYIQWSEINLIQKRSEKKLLRHYLSTLEKITRTEGWYTKKAKHIAPPKYSKINKNAFQDIHKAYDEIGSIKVSTGSSNRKLYSFPDSRPKCLKDWFKIEKGYFKIHRNELKHILENLSDNALRVYLLFKRIESNPKDDPIYGFKTWFKVIRESHLNIAQNTLKKCLKELISKDFIIMTSPVDKTDRNNNNFYIKLKKISLESDSKELIGSFQKIDSETDQIPENCVQLKENIFEKNINLNQKASTTPSQNNSKNKKSDFNFYGMDQVKDPLTERTIQKIQKISGLSLQDVQYSVKQFSAYYHCHPSITKTIPKPVGLLYHHLTEFKECYIGPEGFLEVLHHEHLGPDRFLSMKNRKKDSNADKSGYEIENDWLEDEEQSFCDSQNTYEPIVNRTKLVPEPKGRKVRGKELEDGLKNLSELLENFSA